MRDILTSNEHIQLKKIFKSIELLKNKTALIVLSADTHKLSLALNDYILKEGNISTYNTEKIPNNNIIQDIITSHKNSFLLINLFLHKDINEIIKFLNYDRDDVFKHKLKLIFLFDKESSKILKQKAFDFFPEII